MRLEVRLLNFTLKPRSLLWNPILTTRAPREVKILIGVHMWIDVEFFVLARFGEIWAWKLAHWISPWTFELALGPDVDNICTKRTWVFSRLPYMNWCEILNFNWFYLVLDMNIRLLSFTLDLGICSATRCWHHLHQRNVIFQLESVCDLICISGF